MSDRSIDIITIGDAIIDTFLQVQKSSKFTHVNHATCQVCFDSGSKILVDDAKFELGGNATNVSVGLSRLGFSGALGAEIGTDEFSEKILHALQKEKISKELLIQTPDTPSTFSICLNVEDDRTLFVRHVLRKHAISLENASCLWVYLTSLGREWRRVYADAATFVKQTGVKLAFNPGSTQIFEGRESFKDVLLVTDLLFVNKEEAEEIVYGALQHTQNATTTSEALLRELQKLGPKMICLTDGKNGAYVLTEEGEFITQKIIPDVAVVEKTGAGDAFASGFLGALMHGKNFQEAALWGAINSASVLQHIGAESGLLTKNEIEERMKTLSI